MAMTSVLEQSLNDMQLHGSLLPTKVFVGGLAEQTETKDLREMFQAYARVQDVKIIVDRSVTSKSGDPRRYAFVAFETAEEVKKVLSEVAEKALDLHGRRLTIGQAFRKERTFGRSYNPSVADPALPYRLAMNSLAAWGLKQPGMMQPMQYAPYGFHSDQQMFPMSPFYNNMMIPSWSVATSNPSSHIQQPHLQQRMNGDALQYPTVLSSQIPVSQMVQVQKTYDRSYGLNMPGMSSNGASCGVDETGPDACLYKQQAIQNGQCEQRQRTAGRMLPAIPPFRVQANQTNGYQHQGPMTASVGCDTASQYNSGQGMRHYI